MTPFAPAHWHPLLATVVLISISLWSGCRSTHTSTAGRSGADVPDAAASCDSTMPNIQATNNLDSPPSTPSNRYQTPIASVILFHRQHIFSCFKTAGNLLMTWTVESDGVATHVDDDPSGSTVHDQDVITCARALIERIKFPANPDGGKTTTRYQFNFRP